MSKNSSQRLFIAFSFPQEIKDFIDGYISDIKPCFSVGKWESKEKFHITLKFLGNVEREKHLAVSKSLDKLLSDIQPIRSKIEDFQAFPNFKKPRVCVLTLLDESSIQEVYKLVNIACRENGFPSEKRKFIPHVTIGRVKKDFEILKNASEIENREFLLSKIMIVKSELTKAGSFYTNLDKWELKY